MPDEIEPVRQIWNSRLVHDHEWLLSTLKVALVISAPLMLLDQSMRQKERAVPPVSSSWPTRASEVPEEKLVPLKKLVLGYGL